MRLILTFVLALLCGTMQAAIYQNAFTTNANQSLGATSSSTYPLMIDNSSGTVTPSGILFSPSFHMTGTNGLFGGTLSLNGRTNKLSIVNDTLYLDGVAVGGSTSTNYYSTIITTNLTVLNSLTVSNISVTNITVQNNLVVSNLYTVNGNHNTMIITNAVRMPWSTLTLTGTNVAQIDLNAGSMFRVYLAANAYFGTVANHPGTNTSQTIQIALIENGTGAHTVTMTNSTWFLNASGASTNAVVTINTNANAITLLTFVTHPTNSVALVGVPTTIAP